MFTNHDSLIQTLYESLETMPLKGVLQGSRTLTKGRSGKRIVFFPSRKNDALMPCESRLEADNCLELEFDRSVQLYRTQPFTINLGGSESYTPDSIHKDELGNIIVREVKFSGALQKENLVERLTRIRNIFEQEGFQFHILTEKNLQLPPRVDNYKFLYRCSHQKYDTMLLTHAIDILHKSPACCTLKKLRNQCNRSNLPPLIADALLFLGLALYDENKKLTSDSIIWM